MIRYHPHLFEPTTSTNARRNSTEKRLLAKILTDSTASDWIGGRPDLLIFFVAGTAQRNTGILPAGFLSSPLFHPSLPDTSGIFSRFVLK
jgi:hypothetical protein